MRAAPFLLLLVALCSTGPVRCEALPAPRFAPELPSPRFAPEPAPEPIPPAPPGPGWQWDSERRVWFRILPAQYVPQAPPIFPAYELFRFPAISPIDCPPGGT